MSLPQFFTSVRGHFKKYHQLWFLALPGIGLTMMFANIHKTGLVINFKNYNCLHIFPCQVL